MYLKKLLVLFVLSVLLCPDSMQAQTQKRICRFPAESYLVEDGPSSVAHGDVNGDGSIDLVVANEADDSITVLLNRGDGTFFEIAVIATGFEPEWIALGDIDSDSDLDLVTANSGTSSSNGNARTFRNDGEGNFTPLQTLNSSTSVESVALANLDDDADLDLVVVDFSQDDVTVYLNNGNGIMQFDARYPVGNNPAFIAIGDINGDKEVDLAIAVASEDEIAFLINLGNGQFLVQGSVSFNFIIGEILLADFDGDQDLDLAAVRGQASGGVTVFYNDGAGTFSGEMEFDVPGGSTALSAGDLDGDGDVDIAVAISGNSGDPDGAAVLMNNGKGDFVLDNAYSCSETPESITMADLDNDGDLDLAIGNAESDGDVAILRNLGDGTFSSANTDGNALSITDVKLVDIDGDLDLDLISTTDRTAAEGLQIHFNDGSGGFSEPVVYPTIGDPEHVAANDIDGDGDLDLAVANSDTNFDFDRVSIFVNEGGGCFAPENTYAVGRNLRSLVFGDFDGDGDDDIGVSIFESESVGLLLNNGDGTFELGLSFGVGRMPRSIATGDLDNDGDPDLITESFVDDTVSVLMNVGSGFFAKAVAYHIGNNPRAVAAGDFDGDGFLDIATANGSGIAILLNRGDGTFHPATNYGPEEGFTAIATGDVNQDTILDLVGLIEIGNGVTRVVVLEGDGQGAFADYQAYFAGGRSGVAVGDVNDDGQPDIVTSGVTLLSGNCFLLGDVNLDGVVTLLDVPSFVDLLSTNTYQVEADINQNGIVDLLDVFPFIGLLSP